MVNGYYCRTAMIAACVGGQLDILSYLTLQRGADIRLSGKCEVCSIIMHIHAIDKDGYFPFTRACLNGHIHVLDWLISQGLTAAEMTRCGMYTIFMYYKSQATVKRRS